MNAWTRHLRPALAGLAVYEALGPAERRRCPAARAPARQRVPRALAAGGDGRARGTVQDLELGRYPDSSGRSLRRLLAKLHGCEPERVVLGNGRSTR